ncbi:ubiquitin-conjugating enzyme e2c-binding protein [Diplodia corticola]|uniref:Ubiquitin-conjugating enzyme e2c-binding protein n=1 Tax=Diplodia corticola TaxID=236234 RepID=A0A1J9RBM5_9PEZI|nr:ubiquitin-conjugating enzyme e2c-binding protein [Diplodia corticola]OJD29851.1 ubiquitin-conjugating enzyme e2c-binding protein [Diplodia corticola]
MSSLSSSQPHPPHPPSSSSSPPSSAIPHIYAELLVHIRTVTFFASLRPTTTASSTTRAELSPDGACVTLTHAGERVVVRLPARVQLPSPRQQQQWQRGGSGGGGARVLYEGPSDKAEGVEVRLRVREEGEGGGGGGGGGENAVPWDAGELEGGCGRVGCRECLGEVVGVVVRKADDEAEDGGGAAISRRQDGDSGGGVERWMDLPNENWAEMMDFWHCHKPHEHHLPGHTHDGRDDVGKEKGYAASNRIMAKKGVGYVDLTYLLLAEEDCSGVQPSTSTTSSSNTATERRQLICSSCKSIVGVTDPRADGWRIWKWSVAIAPKGETTTTSARSYNIRKWIAAQLLYLIENQAVRKFTITVDSDDIFQRGEGEEGSETGSGGPVRAATRDPIMIWVFTPDLSFSSSIASSASATADDAGRHYDNPTRAMKVLWKPAAAQNGDVTQSSAVAAAGQALDRQSLSTEELSLPPPAFDALKEGLHESGAWLPASARTFREWNVGLLERFAEDEVR